jgi:hypothetical protein
VLTRPGTGPGHGQEVRSADLCSSTGPPVVRARLVACWWARFMLESTDTSHISCPKLSASIRSWVWMRSQVPSAENRRCRFQTVCHGPNDVDRSSHGVPERNR